MKDIKDYLPFYIGCEVSNANELETGTLVGISKSEAEPDKTVAIIDVGSECFLEWYAEETIPNLRPLSDMTNDERVERGKHLLQFERWTLDGEYQRWMLSRGFDMFGLIEAGLAIDKTTLKQEA